ncbi:hypothetical protein R1sor_024446 [Riccia sorocarpa]|uniref:Uncharacterized protein n=1 Tax=Riccia sorocarpa TaxID=122646 RepID=A0ABD3GTS5_9MARC
MSESETDVDDATTEGGDEEKAPVTWEGELKDGWIPVGVGLATYPNGDTYQGNYENGKKNGQGKYTFARGAWFRGKKHGQGVYTYSNGDRYQGEWVDDLRHGQGTYYFNESMSSYIGTWEAGHFIMGQWVWRDGNTYEGTFYKEQPIGRGRYKFRSTNNEYIGNFERTEIPRSLDPDAPVDVKLEFKEALLRTVPVKE